MRSSDEVLREFGYTFFPECATSTEKSMADRIRELESQQAASEPVAVTDAMVEAFMAAYGECEFQNGGVFTHRMGINAGITAALTVASEQEKPSAATVAVLDEYRVVDKHGFVTHTGGDENTFDLSVIDALYPHGAPHRLVRVDLTPAASEGASA